MWTCIICRFATVLDDAVVATERGTCVCLRCFNRETDGARPMPKALRRQLTAVLATPEPA
jgi:hypothetical protein